MVEIINVSKPGNETQCEHCGTVLHYDNEDIIKVKYMINNKPVYNLAIDCPNCKCRTCLHKD